MIVQLTNRFVESFYIKGLPKQSRHTILNLMLIKHKWTSNYGKIIPFVRILKPDDKVENGLFIDLIQSEDELKSIQPREASQILILSDELFNRLIEVYSSLEKIIDDNWLKKYSSNETLQLLTSYVNLLVLKNNNPILFVKGISQQNTSTLNNDVMPSRLIKAMLFFAIGDFSDLLKKELRNVIFRQNGKLYNKEFNILELSEQQFTYLQNYDEKYQKCNEVKFYGRESLDFICSYVLNSKSKNIL